MTVRYSRDVASSSFLCLYKLLFKWKGSIWKSIWAELLIWIIAYEAINLSYRFWMTPSQREFFEEFCTFCDNYSNLIPLTFMLGFYVSAVFGRWQKVFDNIGWIDMTAVSTSAHVLGTTEEVRNMRRSIVRYMVLLQAVIYRDVSMRVKKRFPTMNHLVTAGFMTPDELKTFEDIQAQFPKYWVPLHWAYTALRLAREKGFIKDDISLNHVLENVGHFRNSVIRLTFFDWVQVPLAYTQVVHLAVRTFFVLAILGRQFLQPSKQIIGFKQPMDVVFPFVSVFQMAFFLGWMKVAEVMLNPLGEDDDDFETNWMLDRNLEVGLSIVDDQYKKIPKVGRDAFWADVIVEPLYTPESCINPNNPQIGSCATVHPSDEGFMVRMRRRTISGTHALETEDNEIVPVAGLEQNKQLHRRSSSFAARKLSAIVRKLRGKTDERRGSLAESSTSETTTERVSRATVKSASLPEVNAAAGTTKETLSVPTTPFQQQRRFTVISVPDLEELAEEHEDRERKKENGRNHSCGL